MIPLFPRQNRVARVIRRCCGPKQARRTVLFRTVEILLQLLRTVTHPNDQNAIGKRIKRSTLTDLGRSSNAAGPFALSAAKLATFTTVVLRSFAVGICEERGCCKEGFEVVEEGHGGGTAGFVDSKDA